MRWIFLVPLLFPGFATADPIAESIARTRAKMDSTPVVVTDEARTWLRKRQEEEERQRIEKLLPPAKPAPVLAPSIEQQVVDDLLRQGVR